MKKFTSLLCALIVALAVNASPRLHAQKTKSQKTQLEQCLSHVKSEKERAGVTYKYKQVLKQRSAKGSKLAIAPVARAKKEIQTVDIGRYNSTIMYGTTILFGLHNDERNIHFFFQFPLSGGAHSIEFGRAYTLDEMVAEGSEWDEYDENDELIMHYYTAATFTITKNAGYDVHIAATVTDDLGNEFSLSYDEEPLVPTGETVEVNINRPLNGCDYNEEEHSWLVRAQDKLYNVQLQFYSADGESPAGTFGAADIELSATYISFPTGELDDYDESVFETVYAKDGNISVTENEGRIDISASVMAENGVQYNITLFYALPETESQETFVANDLQVDTWAFEAWGEILVFASTDDGKQLSLDFYGDQEAGIPGAYEINGTNGGVITVEGEQFAIYSGSVTISFENDEYSVSGTVLCWNNVEYTLALNEPEVVITPKNFASESMVVDVCSENQYYEISGFDANGNYMLLTVNSAAVAGDFTSEVDGEYTYAEIDENNYIFLSADIHVTYSDGQATAAGTIRMINEDNKYDVIDLSLNLLARPYVPSVRNVTIGQIYHANISNNQVGYSIQSEDEQEEFVFVISVPLWNEDVELEHTYTLAEMNPQASLGINKSEREYVVYNNVSFTKTALADNSIKIIATILDTRGNTWNLIYEGEDSEIEGLYVELGQAYPFAHADGGIEYEMIDVDNTFACHLVMPGEEGMEDIELDSLYRSEEGGIDLERSYLSIQKVEYKIVAAELRKEAEGEEVWISANVTDERGFQYMLRYHDDGFVLTGDTIQMYYNAEVTTYYSEDNNAWYVRAEGTEYIVNFGINSSESSPVGVHVDDIEVWSSNVEILADAATSTWTYIVLHSVDFVIVSETENGLALEASAVGEDGNVYLIAVNKGIEAVENIDASTKTVKYIHNGMLIIEKNGVKYNILGASLK